MTAERRRLSGERAATMGLLAALRGPASLVMDVRPGGLAGCGLQEIQGEAGPEFSGAGLVYARAMP